jgi:hypothetical protein
MLTWCLEDPQPSSGHAAVGLRPHQATPWSSPAQEKGKEKRRPTQEKEKKREGEESLRRWLKKRRAGAAPVRPQFLLMWLHGRLDLAKKALPAERLTKCSHCWTPSEQRGEKIG